MIALDTNILLRMIVEDDPQQAAAARALRGQNLFLPHGALIETEWVLRSGFGLTRMQINAALRALLSAPGIHADRMNLLFWALDRHAAGADWADMLHIVASAEHETFATFDKDMPRAAGDAPPIPVRVL